MNQTLHPTALVTGASRGIGRAIAAALAREGYDLILVCRTRKDELEAVRCDLCKKYDVTIRTHAGDLTEEAFVNSLFADLQRLDLLVNNAGIAYIGLLQDMTSADWRRVIDTNLTSAFYTCRRAIPLMLQNHRGTIINISSMWGRVGASMEVAYSASKGGLNAMTMALAKELAPSGITVNALACGVVDTEMNGHLSPEEKQQLREEIPADRFAEPEEIAGAVLSLIKAGPYLTGQIIGVDGGYI